MRGSGRQEVTMAVLVTAIASFGADSDAMGGG